MTPMWRCPDAGSCHHDCVRACWRVLNANPLSAWDDRWPPELIEAHRAEAAQASGEA